MTLMSGQQWVTNHYVSTSQSVDYDGDGVKVKDVAASVTSYYLRSSALSGAIIEEINGSGQKNVGYVYSPAGAALARQTPAGSSSYVTWKQSTPVGTGEHDYNVGGVFGSGASQRIELDPLGANVGLEYVAPPETHNEGDLGEIGGIFDSRWSNFFDLSGGCTAAGVAASCSGAMTVTNNAAMQSLFGSRWFDLPGNFDNQALGEERYLRIMADGYDIELGHYRGGVTVTSSTGTVITLTNPTQEQLDAAYQTAYGADSGSSDQDDHDVSTAYHVSIIGGPMYFAPQNSLTNEQREFALGAATRAAALLDTERCSNFINRLLQRAADLESRLGGGYLSNDGVYLGIDKTTGHNLYYAAIYAGRVTASGESRRSGNNIIYGTTDPNNRYSVSWNREFFDLSLDDAALHTLHEALHQIRYFGDQTLARAASYVDSNGRTERSYAAGAAGVDPASRDLNDYLRRHCAP